MTDMFSRAAVAATQSTACFSVHAPVDPSIMPRVLDTFSRLGLIPTVWHSRVAGACDDELQIDIQMADLDEATEDLLGKRLRNIVGVTRVLMAEKRMALSA